MLEYFPPSQTEYYMTSLKRVIFPFFPLSINCGFVYLLFLIFKEDWISRVHINEKPIQQGHKSPQHWFSLKNPGSWSLLFYKKYADNMSFTWYSVEYTLVLLLLQSANDQYPIELFIIFRSATAAAIGRNHSASYIVSYLSQSLKLLIPDYMKNDFLLEVPRSGQLQILTLLQLLRSLHYEGNTTVNHHLKTLQSTEPRRQWNVFLKCPFRSVSSLSKSNLELD